MEILFLEWMLRFLEGISWASHIFPRASASIRFMMMKRTINRMVSWTSNYRQVHCGEVKFREVLALGHGFYQQSTSMTEYQLWERFRHCPSSLTAVMAVNKTTGDEELAGYYVLLPLKKGATDALQNGSIQVGKNIRVDDICQGFNNFSSLYISAVYGIDKHAQVATTSWLLTDVLDYKDRRAHLQFVFVRPTTAEGRAIFEAIADRRVDKLGNIQALDLESDNLRKRYLERVDRLRNLGRRRPPALRHGIE